MKVTLERRIFLEPKYLDNDIMSHIKDKIKREFVGKCTKDDGHILSVNSILEVCNNEDTIFSVKFDAEVLKPSVGDILEGVVCMIFKDGVFINISQVQKMLIPSIMLPDYTYDDVENKFVKNDVSDQEESIISEGDVVTGKVTAVKYNKQNFSCVGSLISHI